MHNQPCSTHPETMHPGQWFFNIFSHDSVETLEKLCEYVWIDCDPKYKKLPTQNCNRCYLALAEHYLPGLFEPVIQTNHKTVFVLDSPDICCLQITWKHLIRSCTLIISLSLSPLPCLWVQATASRSFFVGIFPVTPRPNFKLQHCYIATRPRSFEHDRPAPLWEHSSRVLRAQTPRAAWPGTCANGPIGCVVCLVLFHPALGKGEVPWKITLKKRSTYGNLLA